MNDFPEWAVGDPTVLGFSLVFFSLSWISAWLSMWLIFSDESGWFKLILAPVCPALSVLCLLQGAEILSKFLGHPVL